MTIDDQAKAIHAAVVRELGREPTLSELRALVELFDCALDLGGDVQCESCDTRLDPENAAVFDPEDCVYFCATCAADIVAGAAS